MDIYIQSTNGMCTEYRPKQKDPISVTISPLRIEGKEGHLKIVSGCNMWQACENPDCYFSKAARGKPKTKAQLEKPGL